MKQQLFFKPTAESPPLAIVIPAFKPQFFEASLASMAAQTCKNFHLYIGDDAGPPDLHNICLKYKDLLPITYHRFDDNLGKDNLVAHWTRCMQLTRDEEWIWLFSDDDEMTPGCVESFLETISGESPPPLYHFEVDIIDAQGKPLHRVKHIGQARIDTAALFDLIIRQRIYSTVVNYIFQKKSWTASGGFQQFDLAWSSDIATWLKLTHPAGLVTIPSAVVKWRSSGQNISTINDRSIFLRKIAANANFLKWAYQWFQQKGVPLQTPFYFVARWFLVGIVHAPSLKLSDKWKAIRHTLQTLNKSSYLPILILLWGVEETKAIFLYWLKKGRT